MKYAVIALIACVCYASERKITKKTLGIMGGLLVIAYLMGIWGKEGISTECPWYSSPCADCPKECGWLFGLGCMFEDCMVGMVGISADDKCSDPTCSGNNHCIKSGTDVCGAQTEEQCQEDGDTWCGAGDGAATCQDKMTELCAPARANSAGECLICMGQHQQQLQGAGCTNPDFDAFCAGGGGGDGSYIQFMNKTGSPMYIYFDTDPRHPERIFSPPVVPKGNTTWMIMVPNDGAFNVSSSSGNIGDWTGAQCSITDRESYAGNNMNHAGLSSFEWTIDTANKTVAANISNVSGANVNGRMDITGLTCDKSTSQNNMDLSTTGTGCYKDFPFMTGGANDIPTCSIKKSSIGSAPTSGLTCGDDNDCLGCPLTEQCDWGGEYQSDCYAKILQKKYGCLEWWTNNPKAIDWKNYNTANDSDAYWWGMGEQILGSNTYDPSITYDGSALEDNSQALKCINGADTDQGTCSGYIMTNPDGSLRTCQRPNSSDKFLIKFTITEIMKV